LPTPEPAAELAKDTSFPHLDHPRPGPLNPLINPPKLSRVPAATGVTLDTVLDTNLSQAALLYTKSPLWKAPLTP
jgi:hypothetical protein